MNASCQLIHRVYELFSKGDVPTLLGLFDPKIQWNEAEGFPYADRNPYIGPQAVLSGVFQRVMTDYADFRVEVREVVGGPDVVVMLGRYTGSCRASGKPMNVQCSHTWWIHQGKLTRFQQMVDTAGVQQVLR